MRRLSWSPAISALLNYEDLRQNPEPLDDPAFVATLPPLVSAVPNTRAAVPKLSV